MKTAIYNKGVKNAARRMALGCLLLFASFGSLVAQNDRHYVIKKIDGSTVHYLSHAGNTLQDVTTFGPDCIWYSSNNYNYYFMNGETRMYLKAPLQKDGTISVATNPGTQTLNNNTLDYFFYDWDHGLARGIRHFDANCPAEYNSSGSQCWQVVWVSYESNQWKMSNVYGYEPTTNSARFLRETETVHDVEISNGSGGMGNLADFSMSFGTPHPLDGTAGSYSYTKTPAYTYYHVEGLVDAQHGTNIPEESYYYYNGTYYSSAPTSTSYTNVDPTGYEWSISCEGETQYLSFNETSDVLTASGATPTLYYIHENTTPSHVLATLTLTVTYGTGDAQVTQTRTANVTVKTRCQNPTILPPAITYVGVTLSWLPTADSYEVSWKLVTDVEWNSLTVEDATSYVLTGLQFDTDYSYKVKAECSEEEPGVRTFHTLKEPGLVVTGAIFGGGRMADVQGKTEVVIVNCDSIGSIYGGNDIAGTVSGADGATIMLGVNSGDATYSTYGTTGGAIRVTSVYGGGNGYYTYDGVEPGVEIGTTELTDGQFHYSVTEVGGEESYMTSGVIPTITKTAITVSNDYVKIDSIFGGAKNAFLTFDDYTQDGSLITVNGGTIMAVFGGNNFGGDQGRGKHHIVVNGTTTHLSPSIGNTATTGYGRDFGIRYLFGGGNKVYGSTTNVEIFGGQCDTIFAGGNSADVWAAYLTVNCALAANSGIDYIYGDVYSNAIQTYDGSVITPKDDYAWDGYTGIYNVRTLFGGNNMATFDSKLNHTVPTITLTSGSVGTVYGGGNAGDMWGLSNDDGTGNPLVINDDVVKYGTHVKMASPDILIDNLYGGCQVSNVLYSTWVELLDGHVGTVYGGCNVSGDVGSTRVNPNAPDIPTTLEEQAVFGGTYVVASGGMVYKNLFAGGNGYYHCLDPYGYYISGLNYTEHNYVGLSSPTHNETHVVVKPGATVKGNVYAGGNLARVGFNNSTVGSNPYPKLVGLTSVRMSGGRVYGSVYGGGNMADVYGGCEVQVSGGTIDHSLYGGNDRLGKVNNPASNRIFPESYNKASDGVTSLLDPKVYTYVGLTGDPTITNVYGGGNGDYAYFTTFEAAQAYIDGGGTKETVVTCDATNEPIQQNTFVDVGVAGGENGAHIGTVYGGGDGVTVTGFITVFLNVKTDPIGFSNVGTIFGGNNKGPLALPADIILLNGQVNTVYGGCNEGAMNATDFTKTVGDYTDIGSYVRLLSTYDGDGDGHDAVIPNVKVMDAIYGGCRMNGVTRNSLVLVDGGDFSNIPIYGGSDISGAVGGWSRVATTGGTVGNVYGGGNGGYYYVEDGTTGIYTVYTDAAHTQLLATGIGGAPSCNYSGADIWSGQVGIDASHTGQVFGGGYGQLTSTNGDVIVNIGVIDADEDDPKPLIYGDIYGGSALGNVNFNSDHRTTVNFMNGTLVGNLYGGGLGYKDTAHPENNVEAKVKGKVFVNISSADQDEDNCFIDLRQANIFGCNNTNGSPQDDVEVHVWKTGYTTGDYNSQTGTLYAINQVFGGGNQADYAPQNGATDSEKKTLVYVHNCLNTIRRVFSGGNAAAATGVAANIEGGRFDYVFGGGNGEVSAANIGLGGTRLVVSGGEINHLFGGSNQTGAITGATYTEINGDNTTCMPQHITEFFGGSNMAEIITEGGVYSVIKCSTGEIGEIYGGSNMANITGDVRLDVRGGTITNAFGGSKGVQNGTAANITGNVTLNLEGGTITDAFGGSNYNGNITGNILVNVVDFGGDCGLDLTNVYGGGNLTPYTPTSGSSVVNVMHIAQTDGIRGNVFGGAKGATATVTANPVVNIGYDATSMSSYLADITDIPSTLVPANFRAYVKGNVFGGGDLASVSGSTEVNVFKGEIVKKLVGGGNEAGITGNTTVNISGGRLCTSTDITEVGVYGGCNTSGIVGGNVVLNITGTDATQTTIGVQQVVMNSKKPVNVHGGGYGQGTSVTGNVTVTYGSLDDPESEYPKLYGDLYGGSALGNVNTNGSNSTTVNLYNGSIICISEQVNVPGQPHPITYFYSGNVFGGGLGRKEEGSNPAIAALVNGQVFVNIGKADVPPSSYLKGKVTLIGCNVYGCNNTYGSPQDNVRVDVYQTAHTPGVNGNTIDGSDYAILRVFGGGNEAHYAPEGGLPASARKTHVYVHGCDNTIKYVYGGGNAADAVGVVTVIEGGRFDEVYGGGNGQITPANIGSGSVGFAMLAGHVNFVYQGSNKQGSIGGTPYDATPDPGFVECGDLIVDSYYFGDNEAEHYGDIINTITCEDANEFIYKYVYAGSRWATVYGDIKLTVQGGNIKYLFGGSKGYMVDNIPAEVRRFPSFAELQADDALEEANRKYSQSLRTHMHYDPAHPEAFATELVGTGGNIELVIQGGTIGEVIGGCDELGNVEGKISVIVDDSESEYCPLFVGNVYGGSNHTNYAPVYDAYNPASSTALPTPKVSVNRGTIGGTTSFLIDTPPTDTTFVGNVYAGGDVGNVTCNPKAVVGGAADTDKITIKGNVYGGGNSGNVTGSPQVVVVPDKYSLSIGTPTGGSIKAREIMSNGTTITLGEDAEIPLVAIPAIPTSATGYAFHQWVVGGNGSSVGNPKSPHTVFTMGNANATLSATFSEVTAYTLTMMSDDAAHCAGLKVYGATYTAPVWVTGNASVTVEAIPAEGYAFSQWTIEEDVPHSGASVNASFAATTIFNMGTSHATLTAHFVPVYTLTLASSNEDCTFRVNGETYTQPVTLVQGARVSIEAIPAEGFTSWTISGSGELDDPAAANTIFTMGAGDATVTAIYGRSGETNNNGNQRR